MPDLTELAKYLAAQIDIGTDRIFLDEPWSYRPVPRTETFGRTSQTDLPKTSSTAKPSGSSVPAQGSPVRRVFAPAEKIVIPESAKPSIPSAFESAENIERFYDSLASEKLYARSEFSKGEGPLLSPTVLLVVYAPIGKYNGGYMNSDVGQMVARMFESLKVPASQIAVTYFCKKPVLRPVLPQVAIVLKRMLEKEVSLVRPQTLVFFGDRLLKQALSQNAKVVDFGGTPLSFSGTPATALIDPEEMLNDKHLKVITWKTHIPKCGFFG